MTRLKTGYAALIMLPAVIAATANAQQPTLKQAAPSIKLVLPGADRLYKDLDYVLGLTTAQEQKQLPFIKEFGLDIFLFGVDRTRPIRIDALTDDKKIRYLTFIPIDNLKKFRKDNLDDASIGSKKLGQTF